MENIMRPIYLKQVLSHLDRGVMLVLVGQRRVGKSILLKLLRQHLEDTIPDANVIYINKEYKEFDPIKDSDSLYKYVDERLDSQKCNYLLIDEVQDVDEYELALRSLNAEDKCQIVATGSNAYIFSSELSTKLAGRYVEIPIYSLTYREFLTLHRLPDSQESLLTYLKVGGLPGLSRYDLKDLDSIKDYLTSVYNTVMMRDVIARAQIRNVTFLENLVAFVADNIGKPISIKSISRYMKSVGVQVSEPLITSYLEHLCSALIMAPMRRYSLHGKGLLDPNGTYYFADHGLRNLLTGFNLQQSIEKIMENVVRTHMLAQGFTLDIGLLQRGKIDFVATKSDNRLYLQVTYLLDSESTIAREFGNLFSIPDNYPKYVVSMDPLGGTPAQYPGIIHIHLRDFLKTDF
ncbi:MAG: ATP-binding protein [Bacteroidales bacterium]|nr:ATP-binding protein [Bacteroidales bacterium]